MSTTTTRTTAAHDELRTQLRGALLRPGDDGFEDATVLWNGMIAKTPALVVRPTGTADVVAAVDAAREHALALSVRGGGHHIAGTALSDGGLTLDMSALRGVDVDPVARTATVQAGCVLGDVDRETQVHGLATPLGFISEVGVAGLTLGGGMGYLSRRFGWTVDNLLEVEIVTADDVLRAYRTIAAEAPRELSVWMLMLHAPPAPFVPEPWHGRQVCAMVVCFSGAPEDADAALAPLRAVPHPVVDLVGPMPYTEVQSYLDDGEPKGHHYYWKNEFVADLSDELLATTRELFAECPIPEAEIGFLHLGGAIGDHTDDDGSVGNRDARFVFAITGMWEPGHPGAEGFPAWVRAGWERVRPFSTGGNYVNFQTADEGDERVRATYGSRYDRLLRIKETYDPDNVFRSNRNVGPRRPS